MPKIEKLLEGGCRLLFQVTIGVAVVIATFLFGALTIGSYLESGAINFYTGIPFIIGLVFIIYAVITGK